MHYSCIFVLHFCFACICTLKWPSFSKINVGAWMNICWKATEAFMMLWIFLNFSQDFQCQICWHVFKKCINEVARKKNCFQFEFVNICCKCKEWHCLQYLLQIVFIFATSCYDSHLSNKIAKQKWNCFLDEIHECWIHKQRNWKQIVNALQKSFAPFSCPPGITVDFQHPTYSMLATHNRPKSNCFSLQWCAQTLTLVATQHVRLCCLMLRQPPPQERLWETCLLPK